MKGKYIGVNDGYGIIGYHYLCPQCDHINLFFACDEPCKNCGFSEEYEDPVEEETAP